MSDYPANFHKSVISSLSLEAGAYWGTGAVASGTWSANIAEYCPLTLQAPYLVNKVWWANGSAVANGTADCGVYTWDGTRLFSIGPTTTAGASVVQSVTLGTPVLLLPGNYYMALALSSSTDTVTKVAITARVQQMNGWTQQASASTLPATATFAAYTMGHLPLFGIANATVI